MPRSTNLDDIIGIESIKLGFFKEVQRKISELKTSNIELEQKRKDVQAILDGIPDVMAVLAPDLTLLSVNKTFYSTYPVDDIQGMRCYEVFKGRSEPCSPCPVAEALDPPNHVARSLQILNWHDENRQIECTASLMHNASRTPNKILLMQRDVTLERQYQAKYFQAERMATIGILAEGVAHEINNPLTGISGFAEALTHRLEGLKTLLPDSRAATDTLEVFDEYLKTILMECSRCSSIVQNLLTFGHREIKHLAPVNINDVVTNSMKLLHPRLSRLPEDIVTLELSAEDPMVLGHPGELMQVILNLVLNAMYAVKESGRIRIITKVRSNMVLLGVEDTGTGIMEEHLHKLFEPFFTTKPPGQGIGVGLSTCYNIINKHGGDITVQSEHNKGSIFEVILPYLTD